MTRSASVRSAALVAVLVLAAWAAAVVLGGGGGDKRPSALVPAEKGEADIKDPFAYDPDREEQFTRRAAAGLSHVLYAKSPGGAQATAERVARFRKLIDRVDEDAAVDAETLEAIVFLESAGRADAQAGDDLEGAVGLTQILAETGQNLLDLRVDVAASERLTRRINRAERRGQGERAEALRAQRRRVDERFDPAKALAATGRYLNFAEDELGREDLAIAGYHMGVGNLQGVLKAFGGDEDTPYAEVFFDSSPLRHAAAYRRLARLGDDSSTYLWRVEAAREIMRLHRDDPEELARRVELHGNKNSGEELLHPPGDTKRFTSPEAIETATKSGDLTPLRPAAMRAAGFRIDRRMGELAKRNKAAPATYRALQPEALALLVYAGRGVRTISKTEPLVLTSTVRDEGYQRLLTQRNVEATHGYSLHTTGWAFDVERRYRSREQALAWQFMLDRLQALNLIAWVREPAAIHVTVSSDAKRLLPLLEPED